MNCYYHPNQPAVAQCPQCGRALCSSCAYQNSNRLCSNCVSICNAQAMDENRKLIRRTLILFSAVFIVFLIAFLSEGIMHISLVYTAFTTAYMFAAIPSGWKKLSSIQPRMFVFLPLIGWLIYFSIKFFLSVFVGCFTMPIQLFRAYKELRALRQQNH